MSTDALEYERRLTRIETMLQNVVEQLSELKTLTTTVTRLDARVEQLDRTFRDHMEHEEEEGQALLLKIESIGSAATVRIQGTESCSKERDEELEKKVNNLHDKVEKLEKLKWMGAGMLALVVFFQGVWSVAKEYLK